MPTAPSPPRRTSVLLVLQAAALTVAAVTAVAAPAWGHASSVLPHARISGSGAAVSIHWSAAADDAADVAVAAGIWEEEVALRYLDVAFGGDEVDLPGPEEVAALAEDPLLAAYVLERIVVEQDGQRCPGEVTVAEDFLTDGATVNATCPAERDEVDITITMLHDRDPAYRTFSVDGTVQYAIHSVGQPTHRWDLSASGSAGPATWPLAVAAVATTATATTLLWMLWGRRHRTSS